MKRAAVTLKDVAAAAGVSAMTASKAMRNAPGISDATRDRIQALAKEMGYTANASASMLKSGRSGIIQVIVNEYDIPFYSKLIDALSNAIVSQGMVPFLQETKYQPDNATTALSNSLFSGTLADGVIIHASGLTGELVDSIKQGRPALFIDTCEEKTLVSAIMFPNEEGARAAVQHLAAQGCRRIGIVGPPFIDKNELLSAPTTRKLRLMGAKSALINLGLPYDESVVVPLKGMNETYAREAIRERGRDGLPFDGLFCLNDSSAIGTIRGLADLGLRVPDDVKVIGFDGVTSGEFMVPSLTTISVDMNQLASLAVMNLRQQIEAPAGKRPDPTTITVGYTLTQRESTEVR